MFKKHFINLVIVLVIPVITFSQSCKYYDYLQTLIDQGYTISKNMGETKSDLKQGETTSPLYHSFTGGDDYIIVASSDDGDVTDVDAYLYDTDGTLVRRDSDNDPIAII